MCTVVATAVAMLLADLIASYVIVIVAFGQLLALVGIPVIAVLLAAGISSIAKLITGGWHVAGAVIVTLLLAVLGGYGLLDGNLGLQLSPAGLHLALIGLCALTFGLFLGPIPMRVLGALAMVGAIVLMALQPTSQQRAEAAAQAAVEQRQAEALDAFLKQAAFPEVTDLTDWTNARIWAGVFQSTTWLVSSTGAVVVVGIQAPGDQAKIANGACYFIQRPGEEPAGVDVYPDWCLRTDTGLARSDDTGFFFVQDDRFIIVNPGTDQDVQLLGTGHPATAEDIAALMPSLREMTRDEVDRVVVPIFQGDNTPPIDHPEL